MHRYFRALITVSEGGSFHFGLHGSAQNRQVPIIGESHSQNVHLVGSLKFTILLDSVLAFPSEVRATPALTIRRRERCSGKTCPLHFGSQLGLLTDQLFRQFVNPDLAVAMSSRQKSRFAWDESRCFHANAIVAGCPYRDMGQNLERNQYL